MPLSGKCSATIVDKFLQVLAGVIPAIVPSLTRNDVFPSLKTVLEV